VIIMQMLYAAAALGGVGIIFGTLLALAARIFAVQTDPRVEAVREVLPGANCGACGYPGCTNFAEAVVEGGAKSDGCIPGGGETAKAIAALLGQEAIDTIPLVATVFCAGDNRKAKDLFIYDGIQDCAVAMKYAGGFKACTYGCLGLGNCVRACPFEAIKMGPYGLPVVDQGKCMGCGLCSRTCPRQIIQILPSSDAGHLVLCSTQDRGKTVIQNCEVGCMACKACVKACPQDAISMQGNLAVVDLNKCNDCGECVAVCKPGTIHPRSNLPVASRGRQPKVAVGA
jgi:Na+-translocating ferredoxin:NAD+ oxidoreductase subunit B